MDTFLKSVVMLSLFLDLTLSLTLKDSHLILKSVTIKLITLFNVYTEKNLLGIHFLITNNSLHG